MLILGTDSSVEGWQKALVRIEVNGAVKGMGILVAPDAVLTVGHVLHDVQAKDVRLFAECLPCGQGGLTLGNSDQCLMSYPDVDVLDIGVIKFDNLASKKAVIAPVMSQSSVQEGDHCEIWTFNLEPGQLTAKQPETVQLVDSVGERRHFKINWTSDKGRSGSPLTHEGCVVGLNVGRHPNEPRQASVQPLGLQDALSWLKELPIELQWQRPREPVQQPLLKPPVTPDATTITPIEQLYQKARKRSKKALTTPEGVALQRLCGEITAELENVGATTAWDALFPSPSSEFAPRLALTALYEATEQLLVSSSAIEVLQKREILRASVDVFGWLCVCAVGEQWLQQGRTLDTLLQGDFSLTVQTKLGGAVLLAQLDQQAFRVEQLALDLELEVLDVLEESQKLQALEAWYGKLGGDHEHRPKTQQGLINHIKGRAQRLRDKAKPLRLYVSDTNSGDPALSKAMRALVCELEYVAIVEIQADGESACALVQESYLQQCVAEYQQLEQTLNEESL